MGFLVLLPMSALVIGIAVSIYLLAEWFRHGRRPKFLLLWAVALFLMYWFQVPLILSALGKIVTVTNFNLFFSLTLPVTFLALMLIYLGVRQITNTSTSRQKRMLLYLWFLASVVFFAQQFIVHMGIIHTYTLPLVGNLLFYIPLRALIVVVLAYWIWRHKPTTWFGYAGALAIIMESILGIFRNFLILKNVLEYPPEFWYVALSNLRIFFVLQTLSVILLALGFFLLHREYYRGRKGA